MESDQANQEYTAKLEEHVAQARFVTNRVEKARASLLGEARQLKNPDLSTGEKSIVRGMIRIANELADASQADSAIHTDSLWMLALEEAGVPEENILKVWAVKDQKSRSLVDQAREELEGK